MKSKAKQKSHTHTNPEHQTGTQHASPHTTTTIHPNPTHHPTPFEGHNSQHGAHENLKTKTCDEIETGGFGGFDQHMATSNRLPERATEFCTNRPNNPFSVHFDALHR